MSSSVNDTLNLSLKRVEGVFSTFSTAVGSRTFVNTNLWCPVQKSLHVLHGEPQVCSGSAVGRGVSIVSHQGIKWVEQQGAQIDIVGGDNLSCSNRVEMEDHPPFGSF